MIPAERARQIDNWIFDLDNTLYPRACELFVQVDERISSYVARLLDLEQGDARKVQRAYYQKYGTTLRGLMEEHGTAPSDFLDDVHNIDYSGLTFDPALKSAIEQLPGRKFVLTNGTTAHARRVTDRLQITDLFVDFFDIERADLIPKPAEITYSRFLHENNVNPKHAVMFEDLARNLVVPDALGMATVLVHPEPHDTHFAHDWELADQDEPYVHHRTSNLGAFLQSTLSAMSR